MQILILLLKICIIFNHYSNSQIIRLFNKYHLYEFHSQSYMNNYDFLIIGEDLCTPSNVSNIDQNFKKIENLINLKSEPLLYADIKDTLSFLLSVSFESIPQLEKNHLFKGYEIELENYDGNHTCIQIIHLSNVTSKKMFSLKIKDPSFMSQHNKDYTFYMAKISINIIYSCDNNLKQNEFLNNLCHFKLDNSPIITGIKSADSSINISNIKNDNEFCRGNLNYKTCLQKYKPLTSEDNNKSYLIIIQPVPNEFKTVYGIISDPDTFDPNEYVISSHKQKWSNGLVFKIKEFKSAEIAYKGILLDETDKNKCYKYETNKTYCSCNNTCIECNKSDALQVILIETNQIKSKRCSTLIYPAYTFDSHLRLETKFQNAKLNEVKLKHYTIPDLCFINQPNNFWKLKFNDQYKTAVSSLFYNNTLKIKIYSFDFQECNLNRTNSIRINQLVYFKDHVKLNQLIQLISFKMNINYVLELSENVDTNICGKNMIPTESVIEKNQFDCIESKKLVVYFKHPFLINKSEICLSSDNKFNQASISISTDLNQLKFECSSSNIISNTDSNLWIYLFLCLFVLILIITLLCLKMNKKFKSLKQKKIVSFYLSVFVEKTYQMKLKEIVTQYSDILKNDLNSIDFSIIDYTTSLNERTWLLDQSDLIVYVLSGTDDELEYGKNLKIGQNWYHHEFNKLHFIQNYQKKTIGFNFSFNSIQKENKFLIQNLFQQHYNYNCDRNILKKLIIKLLKKKLEYLLNNLYLTKENYLRSNKKFKIYQTILIDPDPFSFI